MIRADAYLVPGSDELKAELGERSIRSYRTHAAKDLVNLRSFKSFVREPGRQVTRLKARLNRKVKALKSRHLIGSVELALVTLEEAELKLGKMVKTFEAALNAHKSYLKKLPGGTIEGKTVNANRELYLWSEFIGGPSKLHKLFQTQPENIPPGVKIDIDVQALRKRIFRYKASLKK